MVVTVEPPAGRSVLCSVLIVKVREVHLKTWKIEKSIKMERKFGRICLLVNIGLAKKFGFFFVLS